ncbi:SusC/RagA family TonB-linked outer membrane protein [Deminuibacter soli]|uniref:TonB-dependent receptor n=1 Tax=Deminuibacter soli TaxID=2291815 RepID=A0A3E1NPN6_9BACT|nr:TonB-dependent receptor [Deminuibacter soli]RFM29896.1 TonB-dependent receptor [Deminuibacter soli]
MRKLLGMAAAILLLLGDALSQTARTVTGRVTDDKGAPLANVTIAALGTEKRVVQAAISDARGNFSISITEKVKTLQFAFVGYEEQRIGVSGKSTVEVKLTSNATSLAEIVVVGYGTQKRKDLTGSVASVKGAAIADVPVPSFDGALSGRAAGVQVVAANGQLNNPPIFRIRGNNSLSLSSYPLVVVDGVPTFTGDVSTANTSSNPLASINPSDIESMDVLKDAAATAIYGSRAANGVVIITTKKGRKGKSKVSYDGWVGWTSPSRLWKLLDATQYTELKNEALKNAGQYNDSTNYFTFTNDASGKPINTRWYDYIYQTGLSHSHTASVSGGNESTTYYLSAGYTKQEGVIVKNSFDRKSVRFNLDHQVSKLFSAGVSANYSNEMNLASTGSGSKPGQAYSSGGLARLALILPPSIAPYKADGSYNIEGNQIGRMNNKPSISYYNPLPLIDNDYSKTENNHIQGNAYLQMKPVKGVTLRTVYGIDYLNADNNQLLNPIQGDSYNSGEAVSNTIRYRRWVWTNTAQYDAVFADKHSFSLLAGTEQQSTNTSGFGIDRTKVSDPFFTNTQGGWQVNSTSNTNGNVGQNYLVSGFGRLTYDFSKKYFVSANLRRDGYSAFAPGRKYGTFYGFSGGWDIARENFWANNGIHKVVNSLKFRGSYGKVGNTSGINDFASYSLYNTSLYNGSATLAYAQTGNKDLTWETSTKTDVGITFGLLDDMITGELAWYKNNIDNLILNVPQSASTGLPGLNGSPALVIPQNVGSMYNKGVELSLSASLLRKTQLQWTSSFNISFATNKVTALAPGVDNIKTSTSSLETANITLPGYSAGYLYLLPTAGVDPDNGRRIFINAAHKAVEFDRSLPAGKQYVYKDGGGAAPDINPSVDQVPFANTQPKCYGGFDNTFRYKGFDLDVLLTYMGGFYLYNGTQATIRDQRFWNNSTDVLNRWTTKGQVTDIPKLVFGDNVSNGSANPISDNVQKGDFLKLRNVSLGYTVKPSIAQKLGIASIRVYVSGQNLAVLTHYKGPDPEVSSNGNSSLAQGVDRNSVANGKVITVGLNVGF